ncbi:MAG: hypothetical protein R3252_01885 [Robiginitalea sp.]|nr:hypothetical protein [Robiginitalea sp.]
MKNSLLGLCALALFLLSSCSTQEAPEPTADFFITKDLSFLLDGLPSEGAKNWPANGCKEIEVKLKIPLLGEVKTTMLHCCVQYVCNSVALTEVLDFFLGDKTSTPPDGIEVISSEMFTFNKYDIRIHPGTYRLDPKTASLQDLEYEVRVNR